MIRYTTGDILETNAQALAIPVNTVGVAGAGLALAARERFPAWLRAYKRACFEHELDDPGDIAVHRSPTPAPRWIISIATKSHWQEKSNLSSIEKGLQNLARFLQGFQVQSLALPALGCGLGGLAWKDVRRLFEHHLADLPCRVEAYLPPMRLIVAGSRDIQDYALVVQAIRAAGFPPGEIVSGAARGVDQLGLRYAHEQHLPFCLFPADWEHHGRTAGFLRNAQMAEYADALVAVWDRKSRGTQHMIRLARSQGLMVYVQCA